MLRAGVHLKVLPSFHIQTTTLSITDPLLLDPMPSLPAQLRKVLLLAQMTQVP